MTNTAHCFQCDAVVSYETGFTMTGDLAEGTPTRIWCLEHAPKTGEGYTLSDLQKWREDNAAERAKYQMAHMEQLGADVYFRVTGPTFAPNDSPTDLGDPREQ